MPDWLKTTVSATDANSYLTIEEADALMEGFEGIDKWDDLEEDSQARLLIAGTRKIDQYKAQVGGWGPKRVSTQRLSFPRATDAADVVPEGVKLALAAYVDMAVQGDLTPLKRMQAEGVTNASILGQNMSFEADRSGLPAESRQELDRLWNSHFPTGATNPTVNGDDASFFFDE